LKGISNIYDVYDTIENKYLLQGVSAKETEKITGLPRNQVSRYAIDGILYKDRYRIVNKDDQKLMEEWDRVRLLLNPKARR